MSENLTKTHETDGKPTHLDLFSGIGGFALAAQWAGFQTIGFAEIDPYASAVLRKHWPSIPNYGDVRNVPAIGCDLITGGFPCQPFSCAGKRRGKDDDRYLWPAMLEVITRCRPTWVIGENVAGLIDMELDRCFTDLETAGYEVQPFVIPACAVGAEQKRERVWICAHAKSIGLPSPKIFKPIHAQGKIPRMHRFHRLLASEKSRNQTVTIANRSANGLPETVDEARLHALGNAIVPQVAYEILKAIRQLI